MNRLKDNGGKFINFTSMAAIRGTAGASAYAVAKAGVIGLTRVVEVGVTVVETN